jgi:hypothetical protein
MRLVKEFEVVFPCHPGSAQVVPDDEHRDGGVLRNHDGPEDAGFGEHHVVAFHADAAEAIGLEDFSEGLVGDRAKL